MNICLLKKERETMCSLKLRWSNDIEDCSDFGNLKAQVVSSACLFLLSRFSSFTDFPALSLQFEKLSLSNGIPYHILNLSYTNTTKRSYVIFKFIKIHTDVRWNLSASTVIQWFVFSTSTLPLPCSGFLENIPYHKSSNI